MSDQKKIGIFYDLKEETYFAIDAFSYSGAKEFAKSPAHYKASLTKERKLDPDREFYKCVHYLCLEHKDGEVGNIQIVDGTWVGAVKEKVIEFKNQGKIVVKNKDYELAKTVASNVKGHRAASELLDGSTSEVTLLWNDKATGVYCKARADIFRKSGDSILLGDLKNFDDLSSEQLLTQQILKNRYNMQMAHYSNGIESILGLKPSRREWIWCENKSPFGVKVRSCPQIMIDRAQSELSALMLRFKHCQDNDRWPAYEESESIEAHVPEWMKENKDIDLTF